MEKNKFRSQYKQDKFCYDNFLKHVPARGFFVEVGASDGVKFSNTWFYEKCLNWTGLCIEPRKKAYSELLKNRSCFCENVGIAAKKEEEVEFLEMEGYGEGMSGIVKNYHPRHVHAIKNYTQSHKEHKSSQLTKIITIPLQDLLDKYIFPHINFLSVDTEGGELSILKTIDWDRTQVDVITVENNYESKDHFSSYLSQKGFRKVAKLVIDEVYVHNNFLKSISFETCISFTSKWASHDKLMLEYKSTLPNGKNWKKMKPSKNSDILVVMDDVQKEEELKGKRKIIVFPREPPEVNPVKKYTKHNLPYGFTYENMYHCVPQFNFLGMNIGELMKLPYKKTKLVSCIVSGKTHTSGARKRLNFIRKLKNEYKIDIFGKNLDIGKEIKTKEKGLIPYKYSLCMENSQHDNYFTEKFTDAIVCWSVPIYWGCPNISKYFPPESYFVIDIESENAIQDFLNILKKPINIKALSHARNLVFSYYNIWSTIEKTLSTKFIMPKKILPIYGFFGFKHIYDEAIEIIEDGDNILEIGAFLGKSTSYMCKLLKERKKKVNFYVVDPWEQNTCSPSPSIQKTVPENMFKKFKENMRVRGFLNTIIPIKSTSLGAYEKLKDKTFKFIFIDGSHAYEDVVKDAKLYGPLVSHEGIFAGDDYQAPGVRRAIREVLGNNHLTIQGAGNIMWKREFKWNLFVIFHRKVMSLYEDIDRKNICLFKTEGYDKVECKKLLQAYRNLGIRVIEENTLPFYNSILQPQKYHAPSAIYHFYKNNLHKNLEYIGFLEYDLEVSKSTIELIEASIESKKTAVLFSCQHRFSKLLKQNDITVNGKNAMLDAVSEYNKFFKTTHSHTKLLEKDPFVCSQQSFICDKNTFIKLGKFLSYLIERTPQPKYFPRPSTIFERYIAIFLEFQPNNVKTKLNHRAIGYHQGYKY